MACQIFASPVQAVAKTWDGVWTSEGRISHLEKSDCPESLKHFWSGHAPAQVSERYVKLLTDRDYRLEWAERVGTGFVLPVGLPGLLHLVRKSAGVIETMVDETAPALAGRGWVSRPSSS